MLSWCGATGAGLRRMGEIGSRSTTYTVRVEGLQGDRGDLEAEHLRNIYLTNVL